MTHHFAMFCILKQLSILFYVILLVELNKPVKGETDLMSVIFGFYQIPWENMRVLFKEEQISYRSHIKKFDELMVDLVTTHLVYELKIKPMGECLFVISVIRQTSLKYNIFDQFYRDVNSNSDFHFLLVSQLLVDRRRSGF